MTFKKKARDRFLRILRCAGSLAAPQPLAQNALPRRIDPVHLENMLRQIQPNRRNLAHEWLPLMGCFTNHQSGTEMPFGGHPPHHSITRTSRRCARPLLATPRPSGRPGRHPKGWVTM